MRIRPISDIHTEYHRDCGRSFFDSIAVDEIDILMLAGDICCWNDLDFTFKLVSSLFPQIIYCWGNHECYGTTIENVRECVHEEAEKYNNIHVLDNSFAIINGQRFIGGTMWFRNDPLNRIYEHMMKDFTLMSKIRETVYEENEKTIKFLEKSVEPEDIVMTHHLPSYLAVDQKWINSPLNRFFVCDMTSLIEKVQPKIWINGHTHESIDKLIGKTRLLCNPFGHAGYKLNNNFKHLLTIEI